MYCDREGRARRQSKANGTNIQSAERVIVVMSSIPARDERSSVKEDLRQQPFLERHRRDASTQPSRVYDVHDPLLNRVASVR